MCLGGIWEDIDGIGDESFEVFEVIGFVFGGG